VQPAIHISDESGDADQGTNTALDPFYELVMTIIAFIITLGEIM